MNLYEITESLRNLFESIDPESAEIPEDLAEQISAMNLAFEDKLNGYVAWAKELGAEATACRNAINALEERFLSWVRKREWVEGQIQEALESTNTKKFVSATHSAWIQKNGGKIPVKIADGVTPYDIPVPLTKVIREFNMDAIRAVLETKTELPFATLGERGSHLRIK